MNQGDKTTPEEVYEEFSKALLATLHRTYANYLESKTDDADFKIVANYFHFFKKVISINPDL